MHLFFDLDGTLTDSSPGIIRCINHALTDLRHELAPDTRLRGMIGAPLTTIFQALLGSSETDVLDRAIAVYRARFDEVGIFENNLFPGIAEAISDLCERGHTLQVVTAKPEITARRVLGHFELVRFFAAVHGPALEDRTCDKAQLVGAALQVAGDDRLHAAMIGDRVDDILAARAHDVRAVAVGWGYGSRQELIAASPTYMAGTVADLVHWVQTAD